MLSLRREFAGYLVATHNDNVEHASREQGRLRRSGLEIYRREWLAVTDFFYTMADAVTIARGYTDRSKAFKACFVAGRARMVSQFATRLRRIVQMLDEMVEFCFHACWLH